MPDSGIGRSSAGPVVLILASGRGERFRASGGQVHKLDAMLDGATVLSRTLKAVRESGLQWHLERAEHPGMGQSLAAAARATPGASGWLILPADMPLVRAASLRAVAGALMANVISDMAPRAIVPFFNQIQGHPVAFSAHCREALEVLSGDVGARQVLRDLRSKGLVQDLALDDDGVVLDIDTLADLEQADRVVQARKARVVKSAEA
jgi:molybdenum cofactor cytidylyltransferase